MSTNLLDALVLLRRALTRGAGVAFSGDVNGRQAALLRELRSHGPLSQVGLARATASDPSLVVRLLDDLAARGWVRRDRSTKDRRQMTVSLTAAGLEALEPLDVAYARLADAARSALDPAEVVAFVALAGRVAGALNGLAAAPERGADGAER